MKNAIVLQIFTECALMIGNILFISHDNDLKQAGKNGKKIKKAGCRLYSFEKRANAEKRILVEAGRYPEGHHVEEGKCSR